MNFDWDTSNFQTGTYLIQLRARHIGTTIPYDVIAFKSYELIEPKPNIILIVADDLGWGDLGSYGNKLVKTPSIDRLANEGVRFTQFYVNSPVCSPSRAAILTGRFPGEIGIHNYISTHTLNLQHGNVDYLDVNLPNIANTLQNAGYATAHLGKWHLSGAPPLPSPAPKLAEYGFDLAIEWHSLVDTSDPYHRAKLPDVLTNKSIDFIDSHLTNTVNTPFFLNLWYVTPHAPLNPTPEQLAVYDNLSSVGTSYNGAQQIYYAAVTAMDSAIGRLLDHLELLGIAENTIIMFTSDNGPEGIYATNARHSGVGSPGPFRGRKRSLYEGGIRTPMIVRYPGHVASNRIERVSVISGVDILPTVLDLARVDYPQGAVDFDGESFKDILSGASRPRTKPLMWEWRFGDLYNSGAPQINNSPFVVMRKEALTLLFNPVGLTCDTRPVTVRTELYNSEVDPTETQNLATDDVNLTSQLVNEATIWWDSLPVGPCDKFAGQLHYNWP